MKIAEKAPSNRKAQAEATRQRLLAAAIDAFTARPYDEVSIAGIADAAGTAHGLPYHYFGNKRGLYLAALRAAAAQLSAAHEAVGKGLPRVRIKGLLAAHFAFMRAHDALALALLRGGIGADPEAWSIFEATRQDSIDWFCEVLGLDPRSAALRTMMRTAVGAIDEATVQWIKAPGAIDIEILLDSLLDIFACVIEAAGRLDPVLAIDAALARLRGAATAAAPM